MRAISAFGDTALLLPLSVGLIVLIWKAQSRSAALALIVALGFCVMLTTLLKVGFIACSPVWHTDVVSPSGHASFSTTLYGALALIAARHAPRWQQPPIVLLASILIAAIAVSRVTVGAHSPKEVVVGALIGLMALGLFAFQYLRQRPGSIKLALLFALAVCVLLVFHGAQLPIEQWIRQLAYLARGVSGGCSALPLS
jgi:membrane-associated phospholipid phosphatase